MFRRIQVHFVACLGLFSSSRAPSQLSRPWRLNCGSGDVRLAMQQLHGPDGLREELLLALDFWLFSDRALAKRGGELT